MYPNPTLVLSRKNWSATSAETSNVRGKPLLLNPETEKLSFSAENKCCSSTFFKKARSLNVCCLRVVFWMFGQFWHFWVCISLMFVQFWQSCQFRGVAFWVLGQFWQLWQFRDGNFWMYGQFWGFDRFDSFERLCFGSLNSFESFECGCSECSNNFDSVKLVV